MMAEGRNTAGILEFRNGQPITKGRVIVSTDPNDRSISLHSVPVVTPNCDIVVASLTLRIEPGKLNCSKIEINSIQSKLIMA